MKTVKDILESKPTEVWSIHPSGSVLDALKLMSEKEIGALMVIDEKGKVCGIISERDYARKVALLGKHSDSTSVDQIMTPALMMYKVTPASTVEECMLLMTARHIRHLPVYENDRFMGFLSINDVVKTVISEKEHLIEQLNSFAPLHSATKYASFPGESA
ncbi:MAG: CBS domain-containing protein [Candidatus Hydrogenedentes bacterium]|nr:CBS domain-containing protein [Candidatus Hydrogenedentota bacterium]